MRADAFDFQIRHRIKLRQLFRQAFRDEAAAAHAGIHGEVDLEPGATGGGEAVEIGGFFERGNAGRPVAGDDFLTLAGPGGAQQINAGGHPRIADAAGFSDVCDAEEGDVPIGEGAGDFLKPVAICTGLDHGHQGPGEGGSGDALVVIESRKIDLRPSSGRGNGEGVIHGASFMDSPRGGEEKMSHPKSWRLSTPSPVVTIFHWRSMFRRTVARCFCDHSSGEIIESRRRPRIS